MSKETKRKTVPRRAKITVSKKATTAVSKKVTTAVSKKATTAVSKKATTAVSKKATTAVSKKATTAVSKKATTAVPKKTTTAVRKKTTTAVPRKTTTEASIKAKKAVRRMTKIRACGLCGKDGRLTKTVCCKNWICDDEDQYEMFSFAKNSCYRNHDRYTHCSTHHSEGHDGKWQDCEKCKDYDIVYYVWYATNKFNFEKLENAPKVTIICGYCGFQSESKEDFPIIVSSKKHGNIFICNKIECQVKYDDI